VALFDTYEDALAHEQSCHPVVAVGRTQNEGGEEMAETGKMEKCDKDNVVINAKSSSEQAMITTTTTTTTIRPSSMVAVAAVSTTPAMALAPRDVRTGRRIVEG